MKAVLFASLVASATAFAPAQTSRAATSLNDFCNGYAGGDSVEPMFIGETGSANFDPAGFCEVRYLRATWVPLDDLSKMENS